MIISEKGPLHGLLVVALEQAVAAPFCSSRLADAGARVIKVERQGSGDFARGYDKAANGESAYFVWLNRGKESIELDIRDTAERALLDRMLARADVFLQNLARGALEKPGLDSASLRARFVVAALSGHPQLDRTAIQCPSGDISLPAPPIRRSGDNMPLGASPALGAHNSAIRREFAACGLTEGRQ